MTGSDNCGKRSSQPTQGHELSSANGCVEGSVRPHSRQTHVAPLLKVACLLWDFKDRQHGTPSETSRQGPKTQITELTVGTIVFKDVYTQILGILVRVTSEVGFHRCDFMAVTETEISRTVYENPTKQQGIRTREGDAGMAAEAGAMCFKGDGRSHSPGMQLPARTCSPNSSPLPLLQPGFSL